MTNNKTIYINLDGDDYLSYTTYKPEDGYTDSMNSHQYIAIIRSDIDEDDDETIAQHWDNQDFWVYDTYDDIIADMRKINMSTNLISIIHYDEVVNRHDHYIVH